MSNQKYPETEAIFLGTGTSQGVPVIGCDCEVCQSADSRDKRLRSSLLLKIEGHNIVIDAGPDFRQQMLAQQVKTLRAILLTHEHVDHIFGLDDIRSFNWLQKQPSDVYAEKRVHNAIRRIFSYIFAKHDYPGIPKMNLHLINNKPFEIDGIRVIPIRCYHYKLPVYAFRFGELSYITDANNIPRKEMQKLKGTRFLVINALRREKHISHYNLEEALTIIDEIKPEKAFLTHISHGFGKHTQIEASLPENVFAAFDGLQIKI